MMLEWNMQDLCKITFLKWWPMTLTFTHDLDSINVHCHTIFGDPNSNGFWDMNYCPVYFLSSHRQTDGQTNGKRLLRAHHALAQVGSKTGMLVGAIPFELVSKGAPINSGFPASGEIRENQGKYFSSGKSGKVGEFCWGSGKFGEFSSDWGEPDFNPDWNALFPQTRCSPGFYCLNALSILK